MNLELKLPPLLQLLIAGVAMWIVSRVDSMLVFALPLQKSLSMVLLIAGLAIALFGVAAFRRAGTTVDPRYPQASSELVTDGIYRLTRNPMYLGMLSVLVAWGLYLGSGLSLFLVIAFVASMTRFQIRPEERLMAQKFGDVYTQYLSRVRRWL